MPVSGHFAQWTVLGALVGALSACVPAPQPRASGAPSLTQSGAGYEMDHRRMGGSQGPSASSPILTQPGGGYEMDHSRMGGSRGAGGGTPSVNVTGGGLSGAEFTHPEARGTGRAH